jgi:class 3 adenylate cyclase/tetratricopeptide (TPR) repeat protein
LQITAAAPSAPEASAVEDDNTPPPYAANSVPEGERKTITALFADIKGSTELMRELDPEEARAIIDPVLQLMMDAVHRYDGYVAQSTGDGIFAMFGAPVAHEDHPQRALHAALAIQQELRMRKERLAEREDHNLKPIPLEVRIGVNTGEVVLRVVNTGGHTEYSPVGHAANLAARMQSVAPAGSIVITEECRRLVEGYFSLCPLGPTEIKGIADAIDVYEVISPGPVRGHFELAAQRGLTKFVGRERELAELRRALEFVIGGHGRIVAVVADAGTGKSRLFYEFKATLPDTCKLLEAYSVSHGRASAWLPMLDLLRRYFGIQNADDPASRRAKVRAELTALDPVFDEIVPYLLGLLGIQEDPDPLTQMDAQIRRQRTLEAIKRILMRECRERPLVLIFEDLHWIDRETQALLDLLTDAIENTPILLLVNYRPEYHHEWANKSCYSQLHLDALEPQLAEQMLAALLTGDDELRPLKRLIMDRTGGNPFFIEEMVQALFDDGTLSRNGTARIVRPLSQLRLPLSVQGILASRIDRLSDDRKQLLQTLAVIGRESALALIRQLSSHGEGDLNRMLMDLQAAEFIYEQPGRAGAEYVFKHALTQEVAYSSLLIERRKKLHERAGDALESMFAGRLDDHLSELARHYHHSDNVKKAIEYLGRAGQQALQRSAHDDAISDLNAALDLVQKLTDSPEHLQLELHLQLAVGPALIAMKGWPALEVERTYTRARELCEQLGDPPELFHVLFGLWTVHFLRDELRAAYEMGQQLLQLAQTANESALLMLAHEALGDTSYQMGELLTAKQHLEMAISLYDPELNRPIALRFTGGDSKVRCRSYSAFTTWTLGYPEQALQHCYAAIALAQEMPHPYSLCFAEHFLGGVHLYRREAGAAQACLEPMLALSADHGFTGLSAMATSMLGQAIAKQGRSQEGIVQMEKTLAALRPIGIALARPGMLTRLAEAYIESGRLDEGLKLLEEALAFGAERNAVKMSLRDIVSKANYCSGRAIPTPPKLRAAFSGLLRLRASRARNLTNCARP